VPQGSSDYQGQRLDIHEIASLVKYAIRFGLVSIDERDAG
jgi:hypothetical protein